MIATEVRPITAQDIRALKHADQVTFHMHDDGTPDGESFLRGHRRGDKTSSGFDEYHQVPAVTHVNDYQDGYRPGCAYTGYVHSYRDGELHTLLHHMRAGDTLHLEWVRGNDNPNLRDLERGWHRDELRLIIERGNKKFRYLVDVYVGPDNTARMVRRVR